ncbi:MAG TPA: hypothetical protein DEF41_09650 [Desulfovibrio sp.]|nr:hypothetical protein [Desulfovibrio sp.]
MVVCRVVGTMQEGRQKIAAPLAWCFPFSVARAMKDRVAGFFAVSPGG